MSFFILRMEPNYDTGMYGSLGRCIFLKKEKNFSPSPCTLGAEPFEKEFTVDYLTKRLMKTERNVKAALLDQTVLVGLGNIYVDEALFRAGVHPERKAKSY